jgi:hypothetical protein
MDTTIEININTKSEFRIYVQIRKISMVLGLPDPGSGILKVIEDFSMDLHPHPDPHLDVSQRYGSEDPDTYTYQNVTDPDHSPK